MTLLASLPEIHLRNILFATDFSASAQAALPYGLGMSRRYGATLFTVSVVPEEISDDVQPPDPFYFWHSAEKRIANLAASEQFEGIRHEELVSEGSVPEVLSDLVGKLDIDLVVLGTHGRGGIKKLVLGSVAEEVVSRVRCGVLIVGPHASQGAGLKLPLHRILYAADLLPGSARALRYALWLAGHEHAHLTLLHALKMPADVPLGWPDRERETAKKSLAQLLPPEMVPSLETEFIVEIGAPAAHILRVADAQGTDLIVMGPHHSSHAQVSAHLPWVTLHQILCHARCPVLTARE